MNITPGSGERGSLPDKVLVRVTEKLVLVDEGLTVVEEYLVIGLSAGPPGIRQTRPGLGRATHVGVSSVLEESQGQRGDEVEILGRASVLHHVHQG